MCEETKRKIAVMQAYVDGKPIEYKHVSVRTVWSLSHGEPGWDWDRYDYRVAVTKPSAPKELLDMLTFKARYISLDKHGRIFAYEKRPIKVECGWNPDGGEFASLFWFRCDPGTCEWRDSLVEL